MAILPTISIITVSAFDELRLLATLKSLAALQGDVEHILVTPSEDFKSVSIWDEHKSAAAIEMRILHDANEGVYQAMNIGAKSAIGEYLCFWNAGDELISMDAMQILISRLKDEKPEWLIFQGDFSWRKPLILSESEVRSFVLHDPNSFISHQCMILKRGEFNSLNGFNIQFEIAADTAQMTQLFIKGKPVFENTPVVRVERPNLAAKNHRRSRFETFVIALTSLRGQMLLRAIRNILHAELNRLVCKLKPKGKRS
jgi:hypothetical protein